jgi:Lrp/AsnC family transcriptional regulator, regulator for asnA, asnC and gidA
MEKKTIDNLDRKILNFLIENSRKAYAEIANELNVSPATIFVRVEKMREAGIILGNSLKLDPKMLGYDVCCFIGIILKSAKDYPQVLSKLKEINEVIEVYFTTGHYSIFIKIMCSSIHALQNILINKIQSIDEIQSTETLISLQNPIIRSISLNDDKE